MFEKLLSVLPYNPGLLQQMSFYSQRMREESMIRRTGLAFIVLSFLIQFFAFLSPPVSTVAASSNDLINGGFNSAAQAESDCQNNVQDYKDILTYYGISCDDVGSAQTVTLNSHQNGDDVFSMGRLPYGSVNPSSGSVTDEEPVTITGAGTLYVRLLDSFDTGSNKVSGSDYTALQLKNSAGVTFWLEYPCGNLATVGVPKYVPPPTPAPTPPPTITITPTPQPITSTTPKPTPPDMGMDTPTCTGLSGWASQNESNSTQVIDVYVYANGPPGNPANTGSGTFVAETNNGGHGYPDYNPSWSVSIPAQYQSKSNTFYVYSINQSTGAESGPGISGSGPVYGADPITVGPCATPTAPTTPTSPTPPSTPPSAPPTTPPATCPYDDTISATDSACVVCQYNNQITASNSECKPCEASLSSQDTLSCVSVSKTAANLTQNIADANNTTANPGDTILYTLSAQNNGKATVNGYVFQEDLSDVLVYADVKDLYGGSIDNNNMVTWPAVNIPPGQTLTEQIAVTVKNPVPQTPADPGDPNEFDLTMTNVYGNTINIHVPASPAKTIETTAAALPNTGPGTSMFIAAAIVIVGGYFYGRARLLSRESAIALHNSSDE